ncbi:hypothetical protein ACSQ67_020897 [Phaseolus vulgaris]
MAASLNNFYLLDVFDGTTLLLFTSIKVMFGRGGPRKSDNSKYYDILGVSKNATEDEIKKCYRKVAMNNHPDKGGDPEKIKEYFNALFIQQFKELGQAYEVLGDPEKKEMYDQYGEDTLKEGMGGG